MSRLPTHLSVAFAALPVHEASTPAVSAAPTFDLMALPRELITKVLGHMSPQMLCRTEQTNRFVHSLAKPAWRTLYGPSPVHRKIAAGTTFKPLVLEREMIRQPRWEMIAPASNREIMLDYAVLHERFFDLDAASFAQNPTAFLARIIDELMHDWLWCHESLRPAEFLLALVTDPSCRQTPHFDEVVMTLLMAAGRTTEALQYAPAQAQAAPQARDYLNLARFGQASPYRHLCFADADASLRKQALVVAVAGAQTAVVNELLTLTSPVHATFLGMTPMRAAAARNDVAMLQRLAGQGASLQLEVTQNLVPTSAEEMPCRRPIHEAIAHGAHAALGFLVAAGADIDTPEYISQSIRDDTLDYSTTWCWAVDSMDAATLVCIIANSPEADRSLGEGMLRLAAVTQSMSEAKISAAHGFALMQALIQEAGIDVQARDVHGRDVLHLAAQAGLTNLVPMLLAENLDPLRADFLGLTPLELAQSGGHTECAQALEHAAKVDVDVRFYVRKKALLTTLWRHNEQALLRVVYDAAQDVGVFAQPGAREGDVLGFLRVQFRLHRVAEHLAVATLQLLPVTVIKAVVDTGTLPALHLTINRFEALLQTAMQMPVASNETIAPHQALDRAVVQRICQALSPQFAHHTAQEQAAFAAHLTSRVQGGDRMRLAAYIESPSFVSTQQHRKSIALCIHGALSAFVNALQPQIG